MVWISGPRISSCSQACIVPVLPIPQIIYTQLTSANLPKKNHPKASQRVKAYLIQNQQNPIPITNLPNSPPIPGNGRYTTQRSPGNSLSNKPSNPIAPNPQNLLLTLPSQPLHKRLIPLPFPFHAVSITRINKRHIPRHEIPIKLPPGLVS